MIDQQLLLINSQEIMGPINIGHGKGCSLQNKHRLFSAFSAVSVLPSLVGCKPVVAVF
jgi:hypothetical protein